jgi:hypothetical protein
VHHLFRSQLPPTSALWGSIYSNKHAIDPPHGRSFSHRTRGPSTAPGRNQGRVIADLKVVGGAEKTGRAMWRKGGGFGQKEENWKICSMTTKSVRYIFSNLLVSNLNALLVGTSWGESHNRSEGSEAGAAAIQFSRITAEGVTDPLLDCPW